MNLEYYFYHFYVLFLGGTQKLDHKKKIGICTSSRLKITAFGETFTKIKKSKP